MQQILSTKGHLDAFFLLFQQGVCVRCILRFFRIDTMELYRDRAKLVELVGEVSQALKLEPNLLETYDVTLIKVRSELDRICRLCLGLLQSCDRPAEINALCEQIRASQFEFQKFKFMVKVPNSTMIRFSQAVEYVRANIKQPVKPLNNNWKENHLEIKTVLKWIMAPLVSSQLEAQSTLDENCLQINLSYENQQDEATNFNKYHSLLKNLAMEKLNKKVEKIQKRIKTDKLDNLQKKVANIEASTANLQRILNVDAEFAFRTIYHCEFCPIVERQCNRKIEIRCNSVFLFGYYVKYSRYLSQTPWVVDGKKLADSSIQEELQRALLKYFYPPNCWGLNPAKFHSGGREDIDVRMLSTGRPFALEFCSPRFNRIENDPDGIVKITDQINKSQFLKVNRLEFTTDRCLQILKKSQEQKVKAYACFVHFEHPYTDQDVKKLNSLVDINLNQKTPLRVLHRRTIMIRIKTIHKLVAIPIDSCNMLLNVLASAGTYIKEFVHGDLGRTLPNIGSLTNNSADIFQLDVLKLYEKIDEGVIDDFVELAQKF